MYNNKKILQKNPLPPSPDFLEYRSPRFGCSNPEKMNNAFWLEWVRSGEAAFWINRHNHYKVENFSSYQPTWCFNRFGQSINMLKDDTLIYIAGEHEDSYDPDFYIYNDVVAIHPDGSVEIYGYPEDVFPPTDFHSATYVDNKIFIIGNVGYVEQRKYKETPVYELNLENFNIRRVETFGNLPGWISHHHAFLSVDKQSIIIQDGAVIPSSEQALANFSGSWKLSLNDWHWSSSREKVQRHWRISRVDGERFNSLTEVDNVPFLDELPVYFPCRPYPIKKEEEYTCSHKFLLDKTIIYFDESIGYSLDFFIDRAIMDPARMAQLQRYLVDKLTIQENVQCLINTIDH